MIADYLKRSGDDYIINCNYTENEHGFVTYKVMSDKIVVYNCYGDGRYWQEYIEDIARVWGKSKIVMATKRNYKAFERKFGYKLTGYILEKEVPYG